MKIIKWDGDLVFTKINKKMTILFLFKIMKALKKKN